MSEGPKALVFDDPDTPQTEEGPKALVFSKETSMTQPGPKPLMFTDTPTRAPEPARPAPGPKSLSFENVPSVPVKHAVPGKTLFEEQHSSLIGQAVQSAKSRFDELYAREGARIERQIQQLLPFKMDIVISWGSAALEQEAHLARQTTALIRSFTDMNASECMEQVIEEAQSQKGFFDSMKGMFGHKAKSPAGYRSQMTTFKYQFTQIIRQCDELIPEARETDLRLSVLLASLSSAADVVGRTDDAAMADALVQRRQLLTQGLQQVKLVQPQLADLRRQVFDLATKLEQILNVTLPALELAQARK